MANQIQSLVAKLQHALGINSAARERRKPTARPQLEILEDRMAPANFGTIQGTVFLDSKANNVLDAKDARLPGVQVTLIGTSTGTVANTNADAGDNTGIRVTAITDAKGLFKFTNVPADNYNYRLETSSVPGITKGTAQSFSGIAMTTNAQVFTKNFMFKGGLKPTVFSMRQFATNSPASSLGYGAAGKGTGVGNHTPTVTAIPAISTTSSSLDTVRDLAGFFKDADFTNSQITFKITNGTTESTIKMTLFDAQTPQTVTNFLDYVNGNNYDNSIFHRLTTIAAENIGVLQGGALNVNGTGTMLTDIPVIPLGSSVPNEFLSSLLNKKGTLAMAQSTGINSATNQFFFNTTDNPGLDIASKKFTVFAKVADAASQAALDALAVIPTTNLSGSATIAAGGATESGNTVTITTTGAHRFAVGQTVTIAGVATTQYNGSFTILTTPTPTTFTYNNVNSDLATSGGGTASVSSPFSAAHPSVLANSVPLVNGYAGDVTTFPGDAALNNYVRITDITVDKRDEFLTYSLVGANGGGDAGVATATLTNEYLTINPVAAGTTTFTVKATDRYGAEVTTTVQVTVTGNQAPVVDLNGGTAGNDVSGNFTGQAPIAFAPTGTVTDADNGTLVSLTATLTNRPDGGAEQLSLTTAAQVAATGLGVNYTPANGILAITGSASFATYQAILQGILYNNTATTVNTADRLVTVVVNDASANSVTRTATITVTPMNLPPVANDGVDSTDQNTAATGNLSATDPDANDTLVYSIETTTPKGTLTLLNSATGAYSFEPGDDFDSLGVGAVEDVEFTFKATDNHGVASNVATVTITVTGVNDAPVANDGVVVTDQNNTNTGTLTASDVDTGDTIASYALASQPNNGGSVTLDNAATGAFTFDPGTDFIDVGESASRLTTFTFTATDSNGAVSLAKTITVTVNGINDSPIAADALFVADPTAILSNTLPGSDPDLGDTVLFSVVTPLPANKGILTITDAATGAFTFDPNGDFAGLTTGTSEDVMFTYKITDNHAADSLTKTITIRVTAP